MPLIFPVAFFSPTTLDVTPFVRLHGGGIVAGGLIHCGGLVPNQCGITYGVISQNTSSNKINGVMVFSGSTVDYFGRALYGGLNFVFLSSRSSTTQLQGSITSGGYSRFSNNVISQGKLIFGSFTNVLLAVRGGLWCGGKERFNIYASNLSGGITQNLTSLFVGNTSVQFSSIVSGYSQQVNTTMLLGGAATSGATSAATTIKFSGSVHSGGYTSDTRRSFVTLELSMFGRQLSTRPFSW